MPDNFGFQPVPAQSKGQNSSIPRHFNLTRRTHGLEAPCHMEAISASFLNTLLEPVASDRSGRAVLAAAVPAAPQRGARRYGQMLSALARVR